MKHTVEFKKFDTAKQQAFAEVYLPMVADSQGDFMTAEDIEVIAHDFMGNARVRNIDTNHDGVPNGSVAIESFIAKQDDKTFVPGAWVLGLKVPDPRLWAKIEAGELKALSMEGSGNRTETVLKGKPANRLEDVTINSVSIVAKGANQQDFKIMKHDDPMQFIARQFEAIAKHMMKTNDAIVSIQNRQKSLDANIESITKTSSGRVVQKAVSPSPSNDGDIQYQLRKRERFEEKLEALWERPDLRDIGDREQTLRDSIEKCEDKLAALGYQQRSAALDDNSAFFTRGGSSNFLVASASSIEDVLGITPATRRLSKADEDSIPVENCLIL